jgi:hypothetical protein
MKQAAILAACLMCLIFSVSANSKINNGTKFYTDSSLVNSNTDLNQLLNEILSFADLRTEFELKEADVLNIEASLSHGKKYILYNPVFVESLNNATKNNKWALMTLLAHEIGHHVNGHTTRKGGNKLALELQADEFAGYIMQKMGATLQQSQNVMFYISKTEDSKTHPARSSRIGAIEKGWKIASGSNETGTLVSQ